MFTDRTVKQRERHCHPGNTSTLLNRRETSVQKNLETLENSDFLPQHILSRLTFLQAISAYFEHQEQLKNELLTLRSGSKVSPNVENKEDFWRLTPNLEEELEGKDQKIARQANHISYLEELLESSESAKISKDGGGAGSELGSAVCGAAVDVSVFLRIL